MRLIIIDLQYQGFTTFYFVSKDGVGSLGDPEHDCMIAKRDLKVENEGSYV